MSLMMRFMLPAFLLLFFVMFAGGFLYQKTLALVKNEAIQSKLTLLEQAKNAMDVRIEGLHTDIRQISENPYINQLIHIQNPYDNVYQLLEARDSLIDYGLDSDLLLDYYVVLKKSELVMNKRLIASYEDFYQNYFQYSGMSFDDWQAWISGQSFYQRFLPVDEARIDGATMSVVTYVTSVGYQESSLGLVIAVLDDNAFESMLQPLGGAQGSFAYIADENGTILSSSAGINEEEIARITFEEDSGVTDATLGGTEMTVAYVKSEATGWTYVAVQPARTMMEKVNYFNSTFATLALFFILLGCAVAFALTYRNTKPLLHILNTIRQEGPQGCTRPKSDIFGLIQGTLSDLMNNKKQLQERLQEQNSFLRTALIERMLTGEMNWDEQTSALLSHVGLHVPGRTYAVGILQLKSYGEFSSESLRNLDFHRLVTRQVLSAAFGPYIHIHDVGEQKLALLLSSEESDTARCKRIWSEAFKGIQEKLARQHPDSIIAFGGLYPELPELSRSYEEAKKTLDYGIWKSNRDILWYDDLPKAARLFHYSFEQEHKLIAQVKSGNLPGLQHAMDDIYRTNFLERALPLSALRFLLLTMWGSYLKIQEPVTKDDRPDDPWEEIAALETPEQLQQAYQALVRRFERLCESFKTRKRTEQKQLANQALGYLADNYSNPELSLVALADHFGMSEAHMSRFFKEHIGMNFFEYLEKLRMDKAEELLLNPDIPIRSISDFVGYNSANTFARAFKRLHGVSASAYRENLNAQTATASKKTV